MFLYFNKSHTLMQFVSLCFKGRTEVLKVMENNILPKRNKS